MRLRIVCLVAALVLGVTGCATVKTLQATGGSRADGVVDLSYEYGMFEQPIVDQNQALLTATGRCQAWGYSGAEPFGGTKSVCQQSSGSGGCLRFLVTVAYQCTGQIGNSEDRRDLP